MSEPETWLGNIQAASETVAGFSRRFIDAVARGEVTRGGMAEAGWRDIGTTADGGPVLVRPYCTRCGSTHPTGGVCLRGDR